MREIQAQETQLVSGAGILTTALGTAAASGAALTTGFMALGTSAIAAGKIATAPLVKVGTAVAKVLI